MDAADTFVVVVNDEEQYSLWAAGRELPTGWQAVGAPRTRDDCLAYIRETWTDMRPLRLRRAMGE